MKISILIPCFNEELSLERCIISCLEQTHIPDEIIVVNDGSTDKSSEILDKYKEQVKIVQNHTRLGNKSFVHEIGLAYVTGDVIITTDADSVLDKRFIENIIKEFEDPQVVASAGYVKSIKQNWLTACRQIDYLISQEIHKTAQGLINALYVIPGCAAAYRTDIFKKVISFDHDTLTEDLDFTYKYHKNNLKITFCKDAIVYTQDPSTIRDYILQLRRWHAGNWQNLQKHISVFNIPKNALELSLIYLEGLIFPLLLAVALIFNFKVFLLFGITYFTVTSLFALFGAKRDKRWDVLFILPLYFIISFINYAVFIEQFFREVILLENNLTWFQPSRKVVCI